MTGTAATPAASDAASAWVEPPGVGKALLRGVLIGVVASFIGTGAVLLLAGQSIGAALGMGAFVAVWGGLGFGGMVGGVVWASHLEEADHPRTAASAGSVDEQAANS